MQPATPLATSSWVPAEAALIATRPLAWIRIRSMGVLLVCAVLNTSGATFLVPRKLVPSLLTPVLPPSFHVAVAGAADAGDTAASASVMAPTTAAAPPPATNARRDGWADSDTDCVLDCWDTGGPPVDCATEVRPLPHG